jgi:putative tryptophan/tyrosine transport system substrate-binding protein
LSTCEALLRLLIGRAQSGIPQWLNPTTLGVLLSAALRYFRTAIIPEDHTMRRREFIGGLAAAAAMARMAYAQPAERVRRVALLTLGDGNDPLVQSYRDDLAKLGWVEGRNLRLDVRFGFADADRIRSQAAELVILAPDVIATISAPATRAMQQQTKTIPIVFFGVGDPVANGFVKSIPRPEGNTTGVTNLYESIGGKWVQLLKEAAPQVARIGLIHKPELNSLVGQFPAIDEAARALRVQTARLPYKDVIDIVRAVDSFAATANGGLIIVPPYSLPHSADSQTILRLATQYRIPMVFPEKSFVAQGGMMSYGSDPVPLRRRAAFFVDRILRGAKPGDLPVEYPTKFEMAINLKTIRAIGLELPQSILLRADEIIE